MVDTSSNGALMQCYSSRYLALPLAALKCHIPRFVLFTLLIISSTACQFNTSGYDPIDPIQTHDGAINNKSLNQERYSADFVYYIDMRPEDTTLPHDTLTPDTLEPDTLPTCKPSTCPLGCHPNLPRCKYLKPSHFSVQGIHSQATADLNISGKTEIVINGTTGAIVGYRSEGEQGSPLNGIYWDLVKVSEAQEIAVFGVDNLRTSAPIRVVGSHPVALYVRDTVVIANTITVAAQKSLPGPGGLTAGAKNGANGAPCQNGQGQGGQTSWNLQSGGGGGGWGTDGGDGGPAFLIIGGQAGKAHATSTTFLLIGGCGGGAGGGPDSSEEGNDSPEREIKKGDGGSGGAGGGAFQISAGKSITIVSSGGINAGGGGGTAGHFGAGGGGGGSGGTIYLESPIFYNEGILAANGGGGGSGSKSKSTPNSNDGEDGLLSTEQASGGKAVGDGGSGGAGGTTKEAVLGKNQVNGGGGGGGAGIIHINSPDFTIGTTSPTPVTSTTLQTW